MTSVIKWTISSEANLFFKLHIYCTISSHDSETCLDVNLLKLSPLIPTFLSHANFFKKHHSLPLRIITSSTSYIIQNKLGKLVHVHHVVTLYVNLIDWWHLAFIILKSEYIYKPKKRISTSFYITGLFIISCKYSTLFI